jgi:hypothetical protein
MSMALPLAVAVPVLANANAAHASNKPMTMILVFRILHNLLFWKEQFLKKEMV